MVTAIRRTKPNGETVDYNLDAGQNPPDGVLINYYLKQKPAGEVKLTFLDAKGDTEINTFSSEVEQEEPITDEASPQAKTEEQDKDKKEVRVPKEAGSNRFLWNMRYPEATKVEGYVAGEGALAGPAVPPGTYQVRLTVGDQTYTQQFQVAKDPRLAATEEDLQAQFELRFKIWKKLSETHDAINMLRNMRRQVEDWERRIQGQKDYEAVAKAGNPLKEKLSAIEEELIQVKAKTRQDTLNYPAMLNSKLAALAGVVSSGQAAPSKQEYELYDDLVSRIDTQLKRLREVIDTDIAAFNTLVRETSVPAIVPNIIV